MPTLPAISASVGARWAALRLNHPLSISRARAPTRRGRPGRGTELVDDRTFDPRDRVGLELDLAIRVVPLDRPDQADGPCEHEILLVDMGRQARAEAPCGVKRSRTAWSRAWRGRPATGSACPREKHAGARARPGFEHRSAPPPLQNTPRTCCLIPSAWPALPCHLGQTLRAWSPSVRDRGRGNGDHPSPAPLERRPGGNQRQRQRDDRGTAPASIALHSS